MRAKTVNFERGQDPKKAMQIGLWKINQIKEAMSQLSKEAKIFDKDPKSFSMGFTYKNAVIFFIEINDTYDKNFVAGYEDLEVATDLREEFDTIEECIEWIKNRKDYIDEEYES